jgi:hypothetical protein
MRWSITLPLSLAHMHAIFRQNGELFNFKASHQVDTSKRVCTQPLHVKNAHIRMSGGQKFES